MTLFGKTQVCGPDGGPVPVTLDGGNVTIESVSVPANVGINNPASSPVPVFDAGESITIDDGGNSITVDGALTNEELRAYPLAVAGPLTNVQLRGEPLQVIGGLTDTELRATPVPVTGSLTNSQLRGEPLQTVGAVPLRAPTTASILSTTVSSAILPQNPGRRGLLFSNQSTSKLFLSFTSPASAANSFAQIDPGGLLAFDQQLIFANAVYGVWTNANGALQVTEFV